MDKNERYKRQMTFEQIGEEGQEKLLASRVCIIGSGALGCIIANDLCRSGVGFLRLIDRDIVEPVNLQRQILFTEEDERAGLPKAEAAYARLRLANSDSVIEPVTADVNSSNIEKYIADVDLVIDGTDNFETRFLINEACHKRGVRWIYGGVLTSGGATMNVLYGGAPCFRCFMPEMPAAGSYPTCSTVGVINPITGIIASYESAEALKLLTGADDAVSRSYIAVDVWENMCEYIEVEKNPDCPVCVHGRYELLDRPAGSYQASLCGHDAWQVIPGDNVKADFDSLGPRLEKIGTVRLTKFSLGFEGAGVKFKLFPDGRAIIEDVRDGKEARAIYGEYIGL
jgi:adenylyltransferase/sulfurtransferase